MAEHSNCDCESGVSTSTCSTDTGVSGNCCEESDSTNYESTQNKNKKCRANICCDENTCNIVKHTVSEEQDIANMINALLENFNNSSSGSILIDTDAGASGGMIGITGTTDLIDGHTYYIISSSQYNYGDPLPKDAVKFVYHSPLDITIIGDPRQPLNINQLFALVGYIIDRVSNLCVPCCVKEKINNAIIAYSNNILSPIDNDNVVNIGSNAFNFGDPTSTFTSFCDPKDDISKCGPIYIANTVLVNSDGTPNNTVVRNPIIDALQMMKFYIRSYFSLRCCCKSKHSNICACNMTYNDACKFVFGRFCVVDIKRIVVNE